VQFAQKPRNSAARDGEAEDGAIGGSRSGLLQARTVALYASLTTIA
jgi:hypothetical protein